MSVSPGADARRAARAQAARPPDHQLRGHERDGERDAGARRAPGDGARARGGRGDGRPRRRARAQHRHALAARGSRRCCSPAARPTRAASPSCSTRSAPAPRGYRTDTARRLLAELDIAVLRGNAGEIATLVGIEAEVRGVESIAAGGDAADLARKAAETLGLVASVTGPVDHVSDGERVLAVANGHELLAAVSGTGCMSTAITGAFLAVKPEQPLEAAAEALVAFGVAGEDAARRRARARDLPRGPLRRARQLSTRPRSTTAPASPNCEAACDRRGPRHCARRRRGRCDASFSCGSRAGRRTRWSSAARGFRELPATFVVNDDVEARSASRGRRRPPRARRRGRASGRSRRASCSGCRRRASRRRATPSTGAAYVGAGPVWETPSKTDADPPIGLDGLRAICASVEIPVIAIGGIDASNAGACIAGRRSRRGGDQGGRRRSRAARRAGRCGSR